ncbi:MAG: neutral/alkaline non-lysosomal ceramidase N-terminal domain-containing protein [Candidatus Wallbacteria bacterium]|nr:neutral/alkaline non-lysosomal ceramidase N-terminal domain-containing protein [Candidatus Wallbacteria bacterium]
MKTRQEDTHATTTAFLAAAALLAILALAAPAAAASPPQLRVGTAAVQITPQVEPDGPEVWLAGYGRGRRAEGVHDDLWARAVVFESAGKRIALVTLDLIGLFHQDVEAIRARVRRVSPQIGVDGCIVVSTHTHSGPDTMGFWGKHPFTSGVDPAYLELVRSRAASAVLSASAALAPASLRIAATRAPGLSRDSRLPYVVDERVHVLEADAVPGGRPIVTLVHWSAHPTSLERRGGLVSADYVGSLLEAVSDERDCPAIFLNGAIGGQVSASEASVDGRPAAPRTFGHAEEIGEDVADIACDALEESTPIESAPLVLTTTAVLVPLTNPIYRAGILLGVVGRPIFRGGEPASRLGAALASACIRTEIGVFQIGPVRIGLVPGELYPELLDGIGLDKVEPGADFPDAPPEPALRPMLGGKYAFVICLANDEIGYILPRSRWDEKAPYCFGRDRPQYGERNSAGPFTAPTLFGAFQKLTGALGK